MRVMMNTSPFTERIKCKTDNGNRRDVACNVSKVTNIDCVKEAKLNPHT